jgi:hypothetical protein
MGYLLSFGKAGKRSCNNHCNELYLFHPHCSDCRLFDIFTCIDYVKRCVCSCHIRDTCLWGRVCHLVCSIKRIECNQGGHYPVDRSSDSSHWRHNFIVRGIFCKTFYCLDYNTFRCRACTEQKKRINKFYPKAIKKCYSVKNGKKLAFFDIGLNNGH